MDRESGRPRGFGFITFSSRGAAQEAISKMDQTELGGRTIRVNESRPRGDTGPGGGGFGGGGGGFGGGGGGFGGGGGGGGGAFNPSGAPDVKLYVGNLSFDTTQDILQGEFEKFGAVSDCYMPTDRETGRTRGFAFVTMAANDARAALGQLNEAEIDGRVIRVNEAKPKGEMGGGRGGFGGGGGYGGGGGGGGYRGGGGKLMT